ncbi:MAG: hypothetical protein ACQR33_03000 [Candidatus Saccharibacteria bacterium]
MGSFNADPFSNSGIELSPQEAQNIGTAADAVGSIIGLHELDLQEDHLDYLTAIQVEDQSTEPEPVTVRTDSGSLET